jgi:hypothetical protein
MPTHTLQVNPSCPVEVRVKAITADGKIYRQDREVALFAEAKTTPFWPGIFLAEVIGQPWSRAVGLTLNRIPSEVHAIVIGVFTAEGEHVHGYEFIDHSDVGAQMEGTFGSVPLSLRRQGNGWTLVCPPIGPKVSLKEFLAE